jgi:hypothetical protein
MLPISRTEAVEVDPGGNDAHPVRINAVLVRNQPAKGLRKGNYHAGSTKHRSLDGALDRHHQAALSSIECTLGRPWPLEVNDERTIPQAAAQNWKQPIEAEVNINNIG